MSSSSFTRKRVWGVNVCLWISENVFILYSHLMDRLAGFRARGWKQIFPGILKVLIYWLLTATLVFEIWCHSIFMLLYMWPVFFSLEAFRIICISPNYPCKSRQTTPNIDLFCWEQKATPSTVRKISRPNRIEAFILDRTWCPKGISP